MPPSHTLLRLVRFVGSARDDEVKVGIPNSDRSHLERIRTVAHRKT